MVIGHSTRSLIQQVYLDEGLPGLAADCDLVSMTGSELAESCNMNLQDLESAADEVVSLSSQYSVDEISRFVKPEHLHYDDLAHIDSI